MGYLKGTFNTKILRERSGRGTGPITLLGDMARDPRNPVLASASRDDYTAPAAELNKFIDTVGPSFRESADLEFLVNLDFAAQDWVNSLPGTVGSGYVSKAEETDDEDGPEDNLSPKAKRRLMRNSGNVTVPKAIRE
jgi:hypothetical protein